MLEAQHLMQQLPVPTTQRISDQMRRGVLVFEHPVADRHIHLCRAREGVVRIRARLGRGSHGEFEG
jgi:hypothetical protein